MAVFQGQIVEVGQDGGTPKGILSLKPPDAIEPKRTGAVASYRICLLDAFDKEAVYLGVAELRMAPGRNVKANGRARRVFVLDLLVARLTRVIRSIYVSYNLTSDPPNRNKDARGPALRPAEAELLQALFAQYALVPPLLDNLNAYPALVVELLKVLSQERRDLF